MSQTELTLSGGAIRIFGDAGVRLPSRATWNDPSRWRSRYQGIPIPGEVFAESFLGDQYIVVDSVVVRWDPETGGIEPTELGPTEWIAEMARDASSGVPVWLLEEWEEANGPLPVTKHLAPKQPFVLGGDFEAANLFATDAESDLAWRAQLATQIRDVPDGAQVNLSVRWED